MDRPSLIISLCPTGMVATKEQNRHLPVTPREIVASCLDCAKLGVSVVHVHARDDDGRPTWRKEVFARIVAGIREGDEQLVVSVSTSGRLWQEFERRSACLDLEGDLKPDLASLTPGSMNFAGGESVNSPTMVERLAAAMRDRRIKPEIDVFEPGMVSTARRLSAKGILDGDTPYFTLMFGSHGTSPLEPAVLAAFRALLPADAIWAAGGVGRTQLAANVAAMALGGHVRVGLEDNLYLDKATEELASNQRLVERIVRIAEAMGIRVATPTEARERLGL